MTGNPFHWAYLGLSARAWQENLSERSNMVFTSAIRQYHVCVGIQSYNHGTQKINPSF
jgi:hypothetical protein